MTTNAQQIVEDALRLDPGARELIAETLLESLDLGADRKFQMNGGPRFGAAARRSTRVP